MKPTKLIVLVWRVSVSLTTLPGPAHLFGAPGLTWEMTGFLPPAGEGRSKSLSEQNSEMVGCFPAALSHVVAAGHM